jgi:hypothetical protein
MWPPIELERCAQIPPLFFGMILADCGHSGEERSSIELDVEAMHA